MIPTSAIPTTNQAPHRVHALGCVALTVYRGGRGLAGLRFELEPVDTRDAGRTSTMRAAAASLWAYTDRRGRLRFSCPAGTYRLSAHGSPYPAGSLACEVSPGNTTAVSLNLG